MGATESNRPSERHPKNNHSIKFFGVRTPGGTLSRSPTLLPYDKQRKGCVMFDHIHTIRRLTEAQKIRLLTDIHSLAEPELIALGVPQVRCGSAQDVSGGGFPSPAVLARSWDRELLSRVAEVQCRTLARMGIDHVFLPEAKTRLTPFGDGLSEDPVLAGELAGACIEGADRGGLSASLPGYGLTPREQFLREAPVLSRNRYTFLEAPYVRALRTGNGVGLVAENMTIGLPMGLPEGHLGYILCRRTEGAETVKALAEGRICLEGSAPAVQSALHNHRRLTTAIEHGKATTGELETACMAGEAISEETLDRALTRLLDFASACAEHRSKTVPESDEDLTALQRRAILSSTVLLENRPRKQGGRPTLPLKAPRKVCVVGDMTTAGGRTPEEAVSLLTEAGCRSVTYARGYDLRRERDDALLQEAVAMAEEADTVILMLGIDEERERQFRREGRCTLPAGQLALCDRISRLNRSVVAVISSRMTPDVSFLSAAAVPFGAVLLAPLDAPDGLSVVTDVLMGREDPCGRLPVTLCAREEYPSLFREDRRIGLFRGYRYTDSLGYGARYPFGHGLSYTSFRYSDLRGAEGSVSFTVRNTGKQAGVEVAQVYVGLPESAVLRPKKELAAFAHLELAPGERRTVTLPFELPVVCDDCGELLVEQGTYTLSVGASVSDIRLETTFTAGTHTLPSDGERPEDHLSSLSNIHSHHYYMEAEYIPMKPSLRNLLFGIAALCLAVSVKIYDVLSHSNALFLDIVAGILAAGAVFCFVLELLDRRKQHAIEDARMAEANAALFGDAAMISVPSAAELFAAEDELEREAASDTAEGGEGYDEYDHFADVDKDLTLPEAVRELAVLAREKGISVSDETLRSIFGSLMVSHLAVVSGMNDGQFSALISLLGEYFACHAAVDTVDAGCRSEADLLFTTDRDGNRVPRNILRAVLAAQNEPGKIHIAALNNVDPAAMSAYFVPFARHAHAPHSGCTVECHGLEGTDTAYTLPENLWFILNLKPGTALCRLPDYVTEIATVHRWTLEAKGRTAEGHTEFRHFGYGQMDYLRDRLRSDFTADEDSWKKIDRLESYAAGYTDFRIGNKLWLGMEMYMAVLMSCGADEHAARDEAMAVKLIPSLTAALDGRIPREKRGLSETLDAVFGDDHTALCHKAVKESGADLT